MNTRITLPTFPHTLLGFDSLFRQMEEQMNLKSGTFNYPPHNVIAEDDKVKIEIAVAGFKENELSVTTSKGDLIVLGNHERKVYTAEIGNLSVEKSLEYVEKIKKEINCATKYLHHGLASRDFELKFILGDVIKVSDATLEDGILTINLEKVVPEEHKPKKIKINKK